MIRRKKEVLCGINISGKKKKKNLDCYCFDPLFHQMSLNTQVFGHFPDLFKLIKRRRRGGEEEEEEEGKEKKEKKRRRREKRRRRRRMLKNNREEHFLLGNRATIFISLF